MSLVLDASMALSWYFADEQTDEADTVLDIVVEQGAVVPSLWRLEVANALQVSVRRKRFDVAFRNRALAQLSHLTIAVDPDTDTNAWSATLRLSDQFQLTLYDAAYLELAQRRGLPLASLDRPLRKAAGALGIALLGMAV